MPNRPTFATTAEAVQRGVLEIEYGFEVADGHQNMNGLLKFGLFKNLELRLANNPFERDNAVTGLSDTGVGFKFKVFPQKGPRPTFSILYTATLPTAPVIRTPCPFFMPTRSATCIAMFWLAAFETSIP